MMKFSILGVIALMVGAAGCLQTSVVVEKEPFELIQNKADAITAAGGFAVVGIGSAATLPTAMDKAKSRGRRDLRVLVVERVNTLRTRFVDEIGVADDSDLNDYFSAVINQIESQDLRGLQPVKFHHDSHSGLNTVWVLQALDPAVIENALNSQSGTARHLFSRLRASQGFADLDRQIKSFNAFKVQSQLF